ncbi:MAG: histidinol-phosphate transaminase [Candidatus Methylacidiphilales bacterium]
MSMWDLANQYLRSLIPYEPGKPVDDVARELGLDPKTVIKLASNENPLGPSPKAIAAMREALTGCHIYPDGGAFHLRNALAAKLGVDRTQIILGNGSNEIIQFAYSAFAAPGRHRALASKWAFVVYKLMAQLFNVDFVETPDRQFHHDLDAILSAITPDTRLIFLANPNNPTGTRIPNADLKAFLKAVPDHVAVFLDEAYQEFLLDPPDTIGWLRHHPNLTVFRTFSKAQGLAGLRIGYAVTSPETAEILQRTRQPFNVNLLAQVAALAALHDEDHINATRQITLEGRARLAALFDRLGLRHLESHGNFIMVQVRDADHVFQSLLRRGIIIRSLKSYGLPEWVRVSIGTPDQMDRFEAEFPATLPPA